MCTESKIENCGYVITCFETSRATCRSFRSAAHAGALSASTTVTAAINLANISKPPLIRTLATPTHEARVLPALNRQNIAGFRRFERGCLAEARSAKASVRASGQLV